MNDEVTLVIKIPKWFYEETKEFQHPTLIDKAIMNGTLLPKGHGRLIDADKLPLNAIDDANHGSNYIKIAPTIIEADTESEGE